MEIVIGTQHETPQGAMLAADVVEVADVVGDCQIQSTPPWAVRQTKALTLVTIRWMVRMRLKSKHRKFL